MALVIGGGLHTSDTLSGLPGDLRSRLDRPFRRKATDTEVGALHTFCDSRGQSVVSIAVEPGTVLQVVGKSGSM